MTDLSGQVAVVTGASRGVGRATALALARAGADIVCAARTTEGAPSKLPGTVDEAAGAVRALGRRALAVRCDVSDAGQVEALAKRALAEFGRVDVLVNNAAVNYRAPLAELPVARWDLVMNVNLRGVFLCTKALLPAILRQGHGRIINVSSGATTDLEAAARLGIIAYAVSKAGVETMTQALAIELRPHGTAVNCLRIETAVATEGARAVDPEGDYSDWATPEAVAEAIVRMASWPVDVTGRIVTLGEVGEDRGD